MCSALIPGGYPIQVIYTAFDRCPEIGTKSALNAKVVEAGWWTAPVVYEWLLNRPSTVNVGENTIPEFFAWRGWDGTRWGEAESKRYVLANTSLLLQTRVTDPGLLKPSCLMTYPNVISRRVFTGRNIIPFQVI